MPSECSHTDLSTFSHVDCDLGRGPGVRDPTCNICLDPVEQGDSSNTHRTCQTTWHAECVDEWIETNIGPYADNFTVSCPSCRGKIAQYSQYRDELVAVPDSRTLASLVDGLLEGQVLRFVDRRDIPRLDYVLQRHDTADFVATHFNPTHGVIPSYRIPRNRSGSILFNDVDSVQGGVLILRNCPHETVFLLLTGEQVFMYLSELYAYGWDPATGRIKRRVDLHAMRGRSLPTIMRHARLRGVRDINNFELKYLFPDCRALNNGMMMHIRLLHTDDRRGRSMVEGIMYDLSTVTRIGIAREDELVCTISSLGGIGDDFIFRQMPYSESHGVLFSNVQHLNVLAPFPSTRRNSH